MRTVVIVEPHPLFRLGLRQLLADVVQNASIEGYDYTALENERPTPTTACDLLLLSLTPNRSVGDLATQAVERFAPKRILLLTENGDIPDSAENIPACVSGSVPKEAPPEVLHASVSLVMAGGTCFPPRTGTGQRELPMTPAKPVIATATDSKRYEPVRWAAPSTTANLSAPEVPPAAMAAAQIDVDSEFSTPIKPGSAAHRESQLLGLTPRQYEVLVLLARGYPMKKVGRALNISVATAKAHTETLYQRLDVHNRNAAVYAAVSRGATLGWAHVSNQNEQ
jgi:Response regulator containing a CheY-like receiver domain and an HTH DNA-binding domain